jgi:hypothetical protein
MAVEATLKGAVRRVIQSFRRYAQAQGWAKGDYRILVETNPDWGRIHVILVARDFPGHNPEDGWLSVIDFIDEDLKDEPELGESINLTLRTFDQVEQGGIYSLSPEYVDADDLVDGDVKTT